MKKSLSLAAALAVLMFLVGCAGPTGGDVEKAVETIVAKVTTGVAAEHPELDEQETYIPCSECHKENTPELYESWWASAHGIATVKCYQCHGTYEDMMKVPAVENCSVCHNAQMGEHSGGKTCWLCHPAHGFVAVSEGGTR